MEGEGLSTSPRSSAWTPVLSHGAPDLFRDYFIKSSHNYSTRRKGLDLVIPKVRTESAKNGCFYLGAQAFNNLPPHLKEVKSLVVFKTKLKDLFL